MPHALLVDDDEPFLHGLASVVAGETFTISTATTLSAARAELARTLPDVLLLDLNLPDGSGLELLDVLGPERMTEVVLITGQATVETAVEAMRRGAADYLVKPVDLDRIRRVLTNASHTRELKELAGKLPWRARQPWPEARRSVPLRFGRYEVRGEIGEGAMGRVYRCHDPVVGREVAIKTVRGEHLTTEGREDYLHRFRREAQAAGILSHPAIVGLYDVGEDYLVMEYVEGPTLQELLRHRGRLDPGAALRVLTPLAEALDYAHGVGVIHRDIKPGNIMVQPDGRPKLMDFGVARLEASTHTEGDRFFGSPSYMAPEHIRDGRATAHSDLFSFAVVAYETLTGQRPFDGDGIAHVLYKVVNDPAPAPTLKNPALLPAYDAIFARALAKDPRERYASVMAFVTALLGEEGALPAVDVSPEPLFEALLSMAPGATAATATPFPPETMTSRPSPRRPPRPVLAVAGAAALSLAAFGFLGRGGPPAPAPPPSFSAVRVETEPPGALVRLDGADAGRSPVSLGRVRPGRHRLHVISEGYAPTTLDLELPEGAEAPLRFVLSPVAARLEVRAQPEGARVFLDGRPLGKVPLPPTLVSPGPHTLRVESDGFEPHMRRWEAVAGRTETVTPTLRRVPVPRRPKTLDELWTVHVRPSPTPVPAGAPLKQGMLVPLDGTVAPPRRLAGEVAAYPEPARRLRLSGSVKVEILVGETGVPLEVRVVESAGDILDEAVRRAVTAWRFEPARKAGVRVRVWWPFVHTFRPH